MALVLLKQPAVNDILYWHMYAYELGTLRENSSQAAWLNNDPFLYDEYSAYD